MSFDWSTLPSRINTIVQIERHFAPILKDVVASIEAQIPQGGQGALKLALAKQKLSAIAEAADIAAEDFAKAWPTISVALTIIVTGLNMSGGWTAAIAAITQIVGMFAPTTETKGA